MSMLERYDGTGMPEALWRCRRLLETLSDWYLDRIEHDFQQSGLWRARLVWTGGEKREYLTGYSITPAEAINQATAKLAERYQVPA